MSKGVCLLSGGVDSACAALIAKKAGIKLFGLHFKRERKAFEADYSQHFADSNNFPLKIVTEDITDLIRSLQEPKIEYVTQDSQKWEFLLGRNLIYLTLAANYAVSMKASIIITGFASHDAFPGDPPRLGDYPDCHQKVLAKFNSVLNNCFHSTLDSPPLTIWTPLVNRTTTKVSVFKLALELGIKLKDTITCYTPVKNDDGSWTECGECLACYHKKKALNELDIR